MTANGFRVTGLFLASVILGATGCLGADDGPNKETGRGQAAIDDTINLNSDFITVTVATGGDDLRGSSSLMMSVLLSNGTWSSEREISTGGQITWPDFVAVECPVFSGCQKYPDNTVYEVKVANWDGIDPCASTIRLRLSQGSCFGCTDDNWNMDWLNVDYQGADGLRTLATYGSARLTGSSSTLDVSTIWPPPPGTQCRARNAMYDCRGLAFDPSVVAGAGAFDKDGICDDDPGAFSFNCSAFLYDSGACGMPSGWSCPWDWYGGGAADGCDCDCGVWDPDCNIPGVTVFGCGAGTDHACVNTALSPGSYAPRCVVPQIPQ